MKDKAIYNCQFCLKYFNSISHLKRHKAKVHFVVNDNRPVNNNDGDQVNKNVKNVVHYSGDPIIEEEEVNIVARCW